MVYRRRAYRRSYRRKGFFARMSMTDTLIFINVLVFFIILIAALSGFLEFVINYFALNPSSFFQGYIWTPLTSMFMHVLFLHLFVNMISMFFIGNFVERLIGRKRYLWFYMISGIVASLFFVGFAYLGLFVSGGEALFGGFDMPAIGASGALFGLGGLLAVLIPRLKVLIFFIIPMPMWLAMTVLMFGLWIFSVTAGLPVGNTAHFGGLLVGVAYGFYLRKRYSRKIKMLNKMFG
ncbi:MAG: rhomboid family intramembrane serine protease [Nanoarchaeota archaeon]|nr:rhomboid family intramembrane serine protease [Nanoarchaeota archaeon]